MTLRGGHAMGNLILNSLEIRRFRAFEHLQIERLGRVNLIVGKNNVGKTCLLEALQLFARRGSPELIWEILGARNESWVSRPSRLANVEELFPFLKYIFYGRKDVRTYPEPIQIGPISSLDEMLSVSVGWHTSQVDDEGHRKLQLIQPDEIDTVDNSILRFTIQFGKQPSVYYPIIFDPTLPRKVEIKEINCIATMANGLARRKIGALWDSISLTDLESDVLDALRIIAPGVERLSLIEGPTPLREQDRLPIVKIIGMDEPLPLRSLGDGMQRLFGIALALVNARNGLLLVDEIENGLHYSAQLDVWRLINRLASRLNVQVFATTHSWDCIESFQEASQEDTQNEGVLVRLENKKGKIVATLFDEKELGIAT